MTVLLSIQCKNGKWEDVEKEVDKDVEEVMEDSEVEVVVPMDVWVLDVEMEETEGWVVVPEAIPGALEGMEVGLVDAGEEATEIDAGEGWEEDAEIDPGEDGELG